MGHTLGHLGQLMRDGDASPSAACIIHQLDASNAESAGFYFWKKLCMDLRAYILNLVPVFCTGYLRKMII